MLKATIFSILILIQACQSYLVYQVIGGLTSNSMIIGAVTSDGGVLGVFLNGTLYQSYSIGQGGFYNMSVTGLTPNTLYRVGVGYANAPAPTNVTNITTFQTASAAPNANLTFIVGSNIKNNANTNVFAKMKSLNPNLFFMLGDMQYSQVMHHDASLFNQAYQDGK